MNCNKMEPHGQARACTPKCGVTARRRGTYIYPPSPKSFRLWLRRVIRQNSLSLFISDIRRSTKCVGGLRRRIKKLLNRYADKEIFDKGLIDLIEGHIKICPHCKDELNSLILTKEIIAQKEKLQAPTNFLFNLRAILDEAGENLSFRWVIETGNLAKRLVFVPVSIMILVMVLTLGYFSNGVNIVDDYLFSDLSDIEKSIVSDSSDVYDSLSESFLEELKG